MQEKKSDVILISQLPVFSTTQNFTKSTLIAIVHNYIIDQDTESLLSIQPEDLYNLISQEKNSPEELLFCPVFREINPKDSKSFGKDDIRRKAALNILCDKIKQFVSKDGAALGAELLKKFLQSCTENSAKNVLHFAAQSQPSVNIIAYLIQLAASLNIKNYVDQLNIEPPLGEGATALYFAARKLQVENMQVLLQYNADPLSKTYSGESIYNALVENVGDEKAPQAAELLHSTSPKIRKRLDSYIPFTNETSSQNQNTLKKIVDAKLVLDFAKTKKNNLSVFIGFLSKVSKLFSSIDKNQLRLSEQFLKDFDSIQPQFLQAANNGILNQDTTEQHEMLSSAVWLLNQERHQAALCLFQRLLQDKYSIFLNDENQTAKILWWSALANANICKKMNLLSNEPLNIFIKDHQILQDYHLTEILDQLKKTSKNSIYPQEFQHAIKDLLFCFYERQSYHSPILIRKPEDQETKKSKSAPKDTNIILEAPPTSSPKRSNSCGNLSSDSLSLITTTSSPKIEIKYSEYTDHYTKARIDLENNKILNAIEAFMVAVNSGNDLGNFWLYLIFSDSNYGMQDSKQAEGYKKQLSSLADDLTPARSKEIPDIYLILAYLYQYGFKTEKDMDKFAKAEALYDNYYELMEEKNLKLNILFYQFRGELYALQNIYDYARAEFSMVIRENPNFIPALFGFASNQKHIPSTDDVEKSCKYLKKITDDQHLPKYHEAWFELGLLQNAQKKHAEAVENFKKALSFDPDNEKYIKAISNSSKLLSKNEDQSLIATYLEDETSPLLDYKNNRNDQLQEIEMDEKTTTRVSKKSIEIHNTGFFKSKATLTKNYTTSSNSKFFAEYKVSTENWLLSFACEISDNQNLNWNDHAVFFVKGLEEDSSTPFIKRYSCEVLSDNFIKIHEKLFSPELLNQYYFAKDFQLNGIKNIQEVKGNIAFAISKPLQFEGNSLFTCFPKKFNHAKWLRKIIPTVATKKNLDFNNLPRTIPERCYNNKPTIINSI